MPAKVLLVDDDARLLSGLARNLGKAFSVDMAGSAREAMELMGSKGPFAVVVSDYQMPGMNGIDFLTQVRSLYPDTSRVLLTGNSGVDMAILAVNQGQLFRFLTKPCDASLVELAIQAGVRQNQLLISERELLEQTLTGSVEAMIGLLSHLDTTAFGKAQRITLVVRRAAHDLNLFDLWPLSVSAPMTQLAVISLPLPLLDKHRRGLPLTEEEGRAFTQAYAAMGDLLDRVPRLNPVASILRRLGPPRNGRSPGSPNFASEPVTIQVLMGAMDVVDLLDRYPQISDVVGVLTSDPQGLDPAVLKALVGVLERDQAFTSLHRRSREVSFEELRLGHQLMEPIRTRSGRILLPAGAVLDQLRLEMIQDMRDLLAVDGPIPIIEPLLG